MYKKTKMISVSSNFRWLSQKLFIQHNYTCFLAFKSSNVSKTHEKAEKSLCCLHIHSHSSKTNHPILMVDSALEAYEIQLWTVHFLEFLKNPQKSYKRKTKKKIFRFFGFFNFFTMPSKKIKFLLEKNLKPIKIPFVWAPCHFST